MVNLNPTKLQARVSSTHYHAGNLLPGTNASAYEMRSTDVRRFNIGMARDGVVDCGIALNHNLTAGGAGVSLGVQVLALMDLSAVGSSANSASTLLWARPAGADELNTGARWWLLPDASVGTTTDTVRQITIPELRAPIDAIQLYITPRAVPDAGALNLRVIRRY